MVNVFIIQKVTNLLKYHKKRKIKVFFSTGQFLC
jgi:hypothetical protein